MLDGSFGLREEMLLFYISLLMGLWRNNFGPGSGGVECVESMYACAATCFLYFEFTF